jgi:hypothetical protein
MARCAAGGFILRDGALAPPQDEVWYRTVLDPHGEERGEAARLRTMLRIAGRTMQARLWPYALPRN